MPFEGTRVAGVKRTCAILGVLSRLEEHMCHFGGVARGKHSFAGSCTAWQNYLCFNPAHDRNISLMQVLLHNSGGKALPWSLWQPAVPAGTVCCTSGEKAMLTQGSSAGDVFSGAAIV